MSIFFKKIIVYFFKKNGPFTARFFLLFSSFQISIQLTVNVQYKFCRLLDSNHESEVTALPTEPQPLLN